MSILNVACLFHISTYLYFICSVYCPQLIKYLTNVHFSTTLTAQITQWDILLYGTDEPPQPNDPPRSVIESTFGSEMEHNSLEFEAGTASGQWKDMQQVNITLNPILSIIDFIKVRTFILPLNYYSFYIYS